jgi:leucyl/phenylalanyl-tRNA--protein transferase
VTVYRLGRDFVFPPPEHAEESGLLAVGGGLEAERLLLAYSMGIFPWYSEGDPILWFSPDPRMVLPAEELKVPKSLRRTLRSTELRFTLDTDFRGVIEACARTPRPDQDGTWITRDMVEAYCELHELGFAHSAEAWEDGELVGGLYGLSLGRWFFGESMFAHRPDASKAAFALTAEQLVRWGIDRIDCQVPTEHLARFGAREWPRARFLSELREGLTADTRRGVWSFDDKPPD